MLSKLRPRSVYDVMAAIACFGVLAGGTAVAADTIGSADVINDSLLSEDFHNGTIRAVDMNNNAVISRTVLDESLESADILNSSLTGSDVASASLTGSDVATASLSGTDVASNSLTGSDISEASLDVPAMGCQTGLVQGFARVKGDSSVPSTYTTSSDVVDTRRNCTGGSVEVRRSSTGVFFVRFNGLAARLAVAVSNSDGFGTQSSASDNLMSVNRITGGADVGAFRVEVEDINSDGSSPEDNWFTIVVV